MGRKSIRELRDLWITQADLAAARETQEAQRRTGAVVQSLAVIVGAVAPRRCGGTEAVDLTERALGLRGRYGQAALLLDQQAMQEETPDRAARAREAAQTAKELSGVVQLEFDFFGGGNVSTSLEYQRIIRERLTEAAPTRGARDRAMSTLFEIVCNLAWQSYECTKTAAELSDVLGHDSAEMARTLSLLERVGAIQRVQRGRRKIITVTPEGAYRGNIREHAKAVGQYKLDVIDGGRRRKRKAAPAGSAA